MAATTTPSISWLLNKLSQELDDIKFVEGQAFAWSPTERQVLYDSTGEGAVWQLLHESGHAICEHSEYKRDIELLGYEVTAWAEAQKLAGRLGLEIPEEFIEDNLDTYRDWLHARSLCVDCSQTGIQISYDKYRCLHCPTTWQVNDARQCGLKRTKLA